MVRGVSDGGRGVHGLLIWIIPAARSPKKFAMKKNQFAQLPCIMQCSLHVARS